MMKVIDNREKFTKTFAELSIGDVYYDKDGTLCIKTTFDDCIYYVTSGRWEKAKESSDALVTPLEADLVIK